MGIKRSIATIVSAAMTGVAALLGGCSDGDGGATASPTTATTATVAVPPVVTVEPTPQVRPTISSAETIEVQGVVGAVNARAQTIEIRPTSGGSYSLIQVDAATKIRRAGGGTGQFSEIRSSDRIVAIGVAGEEPETLIASEITIQQVVPGAQPGG